MTGPLERRSLLPIDKRVLNLYAEDGLAGIEVFTVNSGALGCRRCCHDEGIPERQDVQDGAIDGIVNQLRRDLHDLKNGKGFDHALRRKRFNAQGLESGAQPQSAGGGGSTIAPS